MTLIDLIKYYVKKRLDTKELLLQIECASAKAKRKKLLKAAKKISRETSLSVEEVLQHFYSMIVCPDWINIETKELLKDFKKEVKDSE